MCMCMYEYIDECIYVCIGNTYVHMHAYPSYFCGNFVTRKRTVLNNRVYPLTFTVNIATVVATIALIGVSANNFGVDLLCHPRHFAGTQ